MHRAQASDRPRLRRYGVFRPGASGGDPQVLKVEARDLRERRRGDLAAEDRAVGLIDRHEDDEPRLADRHHADEGRDVLAGRVAVRAGFWAVPVLPATV